MTTTHALHSWTDLYRLLRVAAEDSRGIDDASTLALEPVGWPRTTGIDALALASIFDAAIQRHAHPSLIERWRIETERLARETSDTLAAPYSGNRSLWTTLSVAAATLNQLGAALPPADAWQAVIRELAAEPSPACTVPPTHSAVAQFPCVPTWDEMAQLQLRFFWVLRGADLVDGPMLEQIPRTTNADVLQLATYWTEQLARLGRCDDTLVTRPVRKHWCAALDDVGELAHCAASHALYARNTEFWRALVALALYIGPSAGAPAPWSLHVDTVNCPDLPTHRNGTTRTQDSNVRLDFDGATTWDEVARMQKEALATLRGLDRTENGRIIPRTTNEDVLKLAAFWSGRLVKSGAPRDHDLSYANNLNRWRQVTIDVTRLATFAAPAAVYERNAEFWPALDGLSTQIAVTSEAPSKASLLLESFRGSWHRLPDTLAAAAARITSGIGEAAGGIAKGVGLALVKPLLIAAGGVIGLVLLLRALRDDRSDREAHHERSSS
jgi:hypothetical protein